MLERDTLSQTKIPSRSDASTKRLKFTENEGQAQKDELSHQLQSQVPGIFGFRKRKKYY
jgi:hypothetical protein